ncbi:hypothetical protein CC79DRAFT_76064 [Sarocladium strictum]
MRHCLSIVSGHSDMVRLFGRDCRHAAPCCKGSGSHQGALPRATTTNDTRWDINFDGQATRVDRRITWPQCMAAMHGRNAWPRCTTASRPCECYISRVSDFCKRQKRSRESLSCTQRWLRSQLPPKTDPYTLVGPCTRSHKVIQLGSGSIVRPYRHRMYIEIETARSPS